MTKTLTAAHRGANGDQADFAYKFVTARMLGFRKDMEICLTGRMAEGKSALTHAYFPALGSCFGTLEYLACLYLGADPHSSLGRKQIATFAAAYLPKEYDEPTIRIMHDAFRNRIAHLGIASGVWVDQDPRNGNRRLTWKVLASAAKPAVELKAEAGELKRDPPWPTPYTHRVRIHLGRLWRDIADAGDSYATALTQEPKLLSNFNKCMVVLYPK